MAFNLDYSNCQTDRHVELVERLSGRQKKVKCEQCGLEWLRGEPERQRIPLPALEDIKKQTPKPGGDPAKLAPSNELKAGFLKQEPEREPNVCPVLDQVALITGSMPPQTSSALLAK